MGAKLTPELFGGTRVARSPRPGANARSRPKTERAATPQMPAFDGVAPVGTRVLGLDLGLHLGWALLDERGRRLGSGVLRHDRYSDVCVRAFQAETRIGALVAASKPTHVAYEMVRRHEGVQAAHVYGMLEGSVLRACHAAGLRPATVEVRRLKAERVTVERSR